MPVRQIVKTNKRIVFLASGTNNDIGVTASAFLDYGTTDGRFRRRWVAKWRNPRKGTPLLVGKT